MKLIWLIDDDTDDREVFEMALTEIGLEAKVINSTNGEEALELASSNKFTQPDYIFLDLNMPKLGGLEFLEEIRSRNMFQGTPVFIYTTSSRGSDIDHCLVLGGQLMIKHSSFNDLCADLQKQLV